MPIVFHCEKCSRRYRVADADGGRRAECATCGGPLQVPLPQIPTPANQLPIVTIDHELDQADDDPQTLVARHVERYLGPIQTVIRRSDSVRNRIDILHVAPGERHDFHILVTCGLSAQRMNVPVDLQYADLEFAELMMCLPADWNLDESCHRDPERYWPIQLLQELSQLPAHHDTWLGPGHTVPNGEPAEPYSNDVRFSCALIVPPIAVPTGFDRMLSDSNQVVRFHGVVPLFPEETDFKLRHGVEPLLQRFDQYFVSEVLDTNRRNVCRRWWSVL